MTQHKQRLCSFLVFDINDQLSNGLYDKRDDFNFAIINVPHIDSIYQPVLRI